MEYPKLACITPIPKSGGQERTINRLPKNRFRNLTRDNHAIAGVSRSTHMYYRSSSARFAAASFMAGFPEVFAMPHSFSLRLRHPDWCSASLPNLPDDSPQSAMESDEMLTALRLGASVGPREQELIGWNFIPPKRTAHAAEFVSNHFSVENFRADPVSCLHTSTHGYSPKRIS